MATFSSEYECKLDTKGRLVLPAKLKAALPEVGGGELVMRKGFDPCLELYPMVEFKKLDNQVSSLSGFDPKERNFKRNFYRNITEVELDSAGRFLIPKNLLRFAGIDREVVVVGVGKNIEIWSPERYDEYLIQDEEEFSQQAKKFLTPNQ